MDSYLESLRVEWRRSDATLSTVTSGFEAYRRRMRWTMVAAYAGSGAVAACLLFLAWLAVVRDDLLVTVAVIAFVAALPVIGTSLATMRRAFSVRHEDSPFALLLQMRAWSSTMHRMLSSARWCARILLAASGLAWTLFLVQAARFEAVLLLSVLWLVTAAGVWLWQAWRRRRLAGEIARLDQIIAQFRSADGDLV